MKLKNKIFALILLSLITQAATAGTEGGGGGDAVILPDGRVVLADVFLNHNQPQPNNMPRRISLNPILILQLQTYTEFLERHLQMTGDADKSDILKQMKELAQRDNKLVFYSVKDVAELNTYCASGGSKVYSLPNGAAVTQAACTGGQETFLVESVFRKMDVLHQALLLVHERLTTLRDAYGGKNYGAIAGVTAGLGKMLELAYEQQRGTHRRLSADEVRRLELFNQAIVEIEYRSSEVPRNALNWSIHPNGGGYLFGHNSQVDPTAFVDASSYINDSSIIEANTKVLKSYLPRETRVGERTIIDTSFFYTYRNVNIGAQSRITKTNLAHFVRNSNPVGFECMYNMYRLQITGCRGSVYSRSLDSINIGTRVQIDNSDIAASPTITIADDANIKDLTFMGATFSIGSSAQITASVIKHMNIQSGNSLVIKNSTIDFSEAYTAPDIFTPYDQQNVIPNLMLADNAQLLNGKMTYDSFSSYFPVSATEPLPVIKLKGKTECVGKVSQIHQNRSTLQSCVSNHASSIDKKHGPGVVDESIYRFETYKKKWLIHILREFDITISFQPVKGNTGLHTVHNGQFVPAGDYARRTLNFGYGKRFAGYEPIEGIMNRVKAELLRQGYQVGKSNSPSSIEDFMLEVNLRR